MKGEIVYGVRPVVEALRSKRRGVYEVLDSVGDEEVALEAAARGVPVKRVPRGRIEELARGGVHQGVVARVGPYPYSAPGRASTYPWRGRRTSGGPWRR